VEQLRGWHLFFTVFQDYYTRRGDEAYAFLRPSPRFQLGLNLRRDDYESLPVVSDGTILNDPDPAPNPAVAEGRARAAVVTARWAWRAPLFEDWREEQDALLVRSPYGTAFRRDQALRAEATFETSDGDAGAEALSYRRFVASTRGAVRLSLRHWILGALTVGTGSEALPEQRRFALGGQGTLRGREFNEVEGDRMVLASAEWEIEPNAPLPAVIFFYDGGTAWDAGAPRAAWRHDVGAGLAWPPTESRLVRVDVALPLNAVTGDRKPRITGYVRLPF
jgi:outer membrane translocation and assembly module TamA